MSHALFGVSLASLVTALLGALAGTWRLFVAPHLTNAAASRALGDAGSLAAVVVRRTVARMGLNVTLRTVPRSALRALVAESLADLKRFYPHLLLDLAKMHSYTSALEILQSAVEQEVEDLIAAPLPPPDAPVAPPALPAAPVPPAPPAPPAPPPPPAVSSVGLPTARFFGSVAPAPHGRRAGPPAVPAAPPADIYARRTGLFGPLPLPGLANLAFAAVLFMGALVGCGPLPAPDGGVPPQGIDAAVPADAPHADIAPQPIPAAVVAQRAELVIQTLPPAVQLATAIIQLDPQIVADVKARIVALLHRLAALLIPDLQSALAAFCGPGGVDHCAADPAHQCLPNDAAAGISTALADFTVDLGTSLGWSPGPVIGAAISACGAIVDVSLPACHPPAAGTMVHFGADLTARLHGLPAGLRPMPSLAEVQAMAGSAAATQRPASHVPPAAHHHAHHRAHRSGAHR